MKVLDFGAGCPLAVINNWRSSHTGGQAFIRQSLIASILDGGPKEIHCYDKYDKLVILECETKKTLVGDMGKIVLHANQRRLPKSVDMICAFHPDPVSIFGRELDSSYPPTKQAYYFDYARGLAHMIRTRLRIGGVLAIQFDECVKPPMNVPYDATQPFLSKVLQNSQSNMETLYHSDDLAGVSELVPFKGVYTFSSLHIYRKKEDITKV